MPKFSYTAKDLNGKTVKEMVDAFDQNTLVERLQKQGFFIVNIETLKENQPSAFTATASISLKFSHKKVKLDDLLVFCRQMATLLEAGVTMLRSLNIVISQVESKQLSETLKKVRDDVEQGSSLSAALGTYPRI